MSYERPPVDSTREAPGPSGIPNEILRALVTTQGQAVLKTMNDCLSAPHVPTALERARLVLIRKGADKHPGSSIELQAHLHARLNGQAAGAASSPTPRETPDEHGGTRRAANQFGFRKGIGTDSAVNSVLSTAAQAASTPGKKSLCVLVTLDVKNAFNSLRCPVIDAALRRLRTPEYLVEMLRSWLSDRTLLTGADRTPRPFAPQDEDPTGVQLIGFADDLAVVGTAVTGQLLEDLVNPVLRNIDEWMTSHGLELAHHKTEAVILSRRRAYVPPRLSIAGHPITLYDRIRYLGVVLDRNLTFAAHVDTVAKKGLTHGSCVGQADAEHRRPQRVEEEVARLRRGQPATIRRARLDRQSSRRGQDQGEPDSAPENSSAEDYPRAYLFKRAKGLQVPRAPHCPGQNDTAEHTLFECPYWSVLRVPLATHLGRSPVAADIEDIVCDLHSTSSRRTRKKNRGGAEECGGSFPALLRNGGRHSIGEGRRGEGPSSRRASRLTFGRRRTC
ncbi:hypothetical protein QTP88_003987 [Uroleucon formosanum]